MAAVISDDLLDRILEQDHYGQAVAPDGDIVRSLRNRISEHWTSADLADAAELAERQKRKRRRYEMVHLPHLTDRARRMPNLVQTLRWLATLGCLCPLDADLAERKSNLRRLLWCDDCDGLMRKRRIPCED